MRNQSFCRGAFRLVHSRCWRFLGNVHNLFTCALWLPSPAGLRLEIPCENDKKKMNLIFQSRQKFFLTRKIKRACRCEKKKSVFAKIFAQPNDNRFGVVATDRFGCSILGSPS